VAVLNPVQIQDLVNQRAQLIARLLNRKEQLFLRSKHTRKASDMVNMLFCQKQK
jgi:hypothetical protein